MGTLARDTEALFKEFSIFKAINLVVESKLDRSTFINTSYFVAQMRTGHLIKVIYYFEIMYSLSISIEH